MFIVDRRLNPGSKSLEIRQRFLRRAKALVHGAVKKTKGRDVKDVLEGGEGAAANGARMAKRLRGPLWGRMSPQAAAEHLWARKGSGAFGFAREREASALTGDIARFWSKVREALDRLDANTTTDGWSI
jgi:hypothetical protein